MEKSIKKNYFYNLIYQILIMIIPLVTTPYISRVLGAENVGIYSYTYSIVTYFILFGSLGISTYAKREIAYVQDDVKKRTKTFWEIFILKTITLMISIVLYFIIFTVNNKYEIYYRILLIEIFSNILDISWFFQGMENFKQVVIRNTIVKITLTLFIFIFIKGKDDLWKYFLIVTLSTLFGNISFWIDIRKYLCKNKQKLNIKKHLKPAILLLLPQISIQIYTILDKVMLGSFIEDKSEVGFYEQASKIVRLGTTVVTTLGIVLSTRIANIYSKGDFNEIKNKIYKSFKFVWLLGFPIMVGFIISSDNFVPWFYGDGYDEVKDLIKLFSPITIFVGVSNVIGTQYLIPISKQNKYTIAVTFSAIINIILNSILIPSYYAIGATVSSVISEFLGMIVLFYFVKDDLNIIEILKSTKKYIIAAVLMWIIVESFSFKLQSSITNTCIIIIIGVMLYAITLILLKEEFCIEILKSINKKYNEYRKNKRTK